MKLSFFNIVRRTIVITTLAVIPAALFCDTAHVVAKGDTLYSISKKYGSSVQAICDANKIGGSDIKVGQKLVIPTGGEAAKPSLPVETAPAATKPAVSTAAESGWYTVKKGDTWYAISRLYSVNVKELYALNNADANTGLKAGQKVKVPAKTVVASTKKDNSNTNNNPTAKGGTVTTPVIDVHNYSNKKGDSSLVWPVDKPSVTYVNGKVSGVSLSAKQNEAVSAIKSGTVMFSGMYRGFGNVVFIQSKTGHIYAYTGLGKVLVSKGEYIDFKSQIGTAGIDSYSSKPQISLMVFQNGLPIDPAKAPRG